MTGALLISTVATAFAAIAGIGAAIAAFLQWQSSKYQAKVAAFSLRRAARDKLMSAIRLAAQRSTRNEGALAAVHAAWNEALPAFPPRIEAQMRAIWESVVLLVEAEERNDADAPNSAARSVLRKRLDEETEKLASLIDPYVRLDQ